MVLGALSSLAILLLLLYLNCVVAVYVLCLFLAIAVCDVILTFMVPDILKHWRLVVLAGARYYDSSLAIIIEVWLPWVNPYLVANILKSLPAVCMYNAFVYLSLGPTLLVCLFVCLYRTSTNVIPSRYTELYWPRCDVICIGIWRCPNVMWVMYMRGSLTLKKLHCLWWVLFHLMCTNGRFLALYSIQKKTYMYVNLTISESVAFW